MSTSKGFWDARYAKWLVIVNSLVPLALLVADAYRHQLGVNEVNFAIKTTGLIGLTLLVLSLIITPLRRLTGWNLLLATRRNLGVIGFLYILGHFLIFFWWDRAGSVSSTVAEIVDREYLWYGFGALVIMTPLAITSTDAMVSRLGPKGWKRLHRLAYVAVAAGGYHYYLQAKSDKRQPDAFLIAVGVLLLYRFVAKELDVRRDLRLAHAKLAAAKTAAPRAKKKFWQGRLKIARIFQETPDVKTFRFVNPDGGALPFEHTAGQYINLKLTIDGKRVNRSYTIASSPTRNAYCEISVKRAANGYGSKHLHDTWQAGQLVEVSAPAGKFFFAGPESDRVVLIAGGIGITPMMSVVRSLTDRGWAGEMYLAFSVRRQHDIVFAHELAELQKRHDNLHVRITLSDEPEGDWKGARGPITKELLADFIPKLDHGPVMLCGPDPMMTAMRALLVGMGVPDAEIHQEAFISPPAVDLALGGSAGGADAPEDALPEGVVPNVSFAKSGVNAEQPEDQTILEIAEEAGVVIPFECRSGICGQCKTRLVSGKVRMDVQDALTPHDRTKGLILACQARATRDCVVDA